MLICSTNQHQKYDIFHVEHFFQNSKLTLDRSHRDYRALVNKSAVIVVSAASITLSDAHHAQDNLSKFVHIFGKGAGALVNKSEVIMVRAVKG